MHNPTVPGSNITIIDMVDNRHRDSVEMAVQKGVKYVEHKITEHNLQKTLERFVTKDSLLIDLAYSIDTVTLLEYCHENNVLYINTSIEEWDPYVFLVLHLSGSAQ
jgi:homospermidine synthase